MLASWLHHSDEFDKCGRCRGTGQVSCSFCAGSGGHTEAHYPYGYYSGAISRRAHVPCNGCRGTGHRCCTQCSGTGSIKKRSPRPGEKHGGKTGKKGKKSK